MLDVEVCQVCGVKPVPGEVVLATLLVEDGGASRIAGTHLACVVVLPGVPTPAKAGA